MTTYRHDCPQFPIGTIRGPYTCGIGTDSNGGVQYLVNGPDGWVPFIAKGRHNERVAELQAIAYAETITHN